MTAEELLTGPRIEPTILGRLLALYFPNYPRNIQDLKTLASELNELNLSLTDIVESCERILPLMSASGSIAETEFNKLADEGSLTQNNVLRLVVQLYKKV